MLWASFVDGPKKARRNGLAPGKTSAERGRGPDLLLHMDRSRTFFVDVAYCIMNVGCNMLPAEANGLNSADC